MNIEIHTNPVMETLDHSINFFPTDSAYGLFDERMDDLLLVCDEILTNRNVFLLDIHFLNCQLTCWRCDSPFDNEIFSGHTVFGPKFTNWFGPARSAPKRTIPKDLVWTILKELKYLRSLQHANYLHQASINCITGQISLSYSTQCSEILEFENFFKVLRHRGRHEPSDTCKRI